MICFYSFLQIEVGIADRPLQTFTLREHGVSIAKRPSLVGFSREPVVVRENSDNNDLLTAPGHILSIQGGNWNIEIHDRTGCRYGFQLVTLPMDLSCKDFCLLDSRGTDGEGRFMNDRRHLPRRNAATVYYRQYDVLASVSIVGCPVTM